MNYWRAPLVRLAGISGRLARDISVKMKIVHLLEILLLLPFASGLLNGSGSTKVYVSNSLGDDITVIDLDTQKVTADIKVGQRVHGVCAPADGRTLFTTVESEKNLKVIDTATNQVVATIPLTGRPNQCASTPDGHYVAVPIRDANSVDIVDLEQKKVVKVLPVAIPHNSYDADNNQQIFVSSMGDHEIDLIDLASMSFVKKIPVGGIPRPYAVSKDGKTLYSALTDLHGFVIASIPEGKITARVELPPAPPAACPLEPRTPTHGIALSPDERELWVTSLADSGVYVYDVAGKKLSSEIPTGRCPNWITFSPDGRFVAVSNSDSDDCSIIDTRTRREVARLKVGKGPKRLLALQIP
jgi:YVTN family beta-propeller protein